MCDTIWKDLQEAGVVAANRPAPVVSSPPWRARLQSQANLQAAAAGSSGSTTPTLPAAAASGSSWLPAGWLDAFGQQVVFACEDVNAKANMCYLFIYIYIYREED
jgi:hypothetical protein